MEGSSSIRIDKLCDNNFHTWKQKIELIMSLRELEDHIDIECCKLLPTDDEALAKWNKADAKAKAIIGLNLSDEYLEQINECSTAIGMWTTIQELFQRSTLLNKLHARRKFYSSIMKEDEKVLVFIARVRQYASDLKSMSVEITDEEVAMTILSGLPSRFEHLIVAIDTTKEDSLSVEFVKSRILQEEQRLSERQSSITPRTPSALINNRGGKFCTFCKMKNHTESYCWKKYPEKRPKSFGQSLVSEGGNDSSKNNDGHHDEDHERNRNAFCLHLAYDHMSTSNFRWIIDSGATAHMTYDRNLFQTYQDIIPFEVYTGNKEILKAIGKGTIKINVSRNKVGSVCILKDVILVENLKYHLL